MMKKTTMFLTFLIGWGAGSWGLAQTPTDHSYKPLQVKLNDDGSKYIRFIVWNQTQLSSQLQTDGKSADDGVHFSIRRARLLTFAQVSPRFLVLTHFGLNSLGAAGLTGNPNTQTANNSSLLFLHDAYGEFAVIDEKLHIGSGLHYWNGISRLTNQSTLNMMTMDNPGSGVGDARLFPWSTITTSDQFARHLGIFAKGTLGKFSYRVSANNARKNVGTLDSLVTSYQVQGDGKDWLYTGYFNYNFLDGESDKLPYFVGTYMGKKKVLNIGFGFNTTPNALRAGYVDTMGATIFTKKEAVTFLGADIFYDAPIGNKGHAINALAAYYQSQYGSNGNFGSGGLVPGSGSILYGQFGYYLPVKDQGIMPYLTYSHQDLANTPNTSYELGIGMNWFINGHNAKLTAEYNTGVKGALNAGVNSRATLQMHIFL
jgi:hypothetical protein